MTAAEWLACTKPGKMLQHLGNAGSDRKRRLFAVACCRRVDRLLAAKPCREAVPVAERFADGLADNAALARAQQFAEFAAWPCGTGRGAGPAAAWCVDPDADTAARRTAETAQLAVSEAEGLTWKIEERAQSDLLRDIFGLLPFRAPALAPAWLTPGGTIYQLALAIYAESAFDRLPILGDALEDAGCTSREMLHHCRQGGAHVRGCWIVDALLGKE